MKLNEVQNDIIDLKNTLEALKESNYFTNKYAVDCLDAIINEVNVIKKQFSILQLGIEMEQMMKGEDE